MRVFIGIGSNLGDPLTQVKTAILELNKLPNAQLVKCSALYASPPMGPQDQPDYINAVAELETQLTPYELLEVLQYIEQHHGRVRHRHWGERTLDLDILLYGKDIIDDDHLTVPHSGLTVRAFVIYPLAEIAPQLDIPGHGMLSEILPNCPRGELKKVDVMNL